MSDIISLQRENLLRHLAAVKTPNNLKFLVLDESTESLVNFIIDRRTLLKNVTAVQRIDQQRNSQPDMDAVYIIDPTKFSLHCLKADFKVVPPRYRSMFVYLLPSPSVEQIIKNFTDNNVNPVYKLIREIRVLNFNYYPMDGNFFLANVDTTQNYVEPNMKVFDEPDPIKLKEKSAELKKQYIDIKKYNMYSMQTFYNPGFRNLINYQVDQIVNSLLNICILTNEYPTIRYYSPRVSLNEATRACKLIASNLQAKIDDYSRRHPDFTPSSESTTLLVTDRTMDLAQIFQHEFTYESMLYDWIPKNQLNTKNQIIFYQTKSESGMVGEKLSKLDTKDPYFIKYRHLHIRDAFETVGKDIQTFLDANPTMVNKDQEVTASDLLHIVANSASFDNERRLLTLHKQMIERMLTVNSDLGLMAVSNFEQILLADGHDIEGTRHKWSKLTSDLIEILLQMNEKNYDLTHKIRVIAIYCLKKKDGVMESDLNKLLKFIGVVKDREVKMWLDFFHNLEILNHRTLKPNKSPSEYGTYNDQNLNTSRYIPGIAQVIQNIDNKISSELEEFPYINEALNFIEEQPVATTKTSLKSDNLKASWYPRAHTNRKKGKMIVYFVGGVTTGELRACEEVGKKLSKDIIVGSETLLVPNETPFNVANLKNSHVEELNPWIIASLNKVSVDKAPSYLFESGLKQPQRPQHGAVPRPGNPGVSERISDHHSQHKGHAFGHKFGPSHKSSDPNKPKPNLDMPIGAEKKNKLSKLIKRK